MQEFVNKQIPQTSVIIITDAPAQIETIVSETVATNPPETQTNSILSEDDIYYLVVMLSHECSPRASASHNANAVACMINRVNDGWATSIYNAIQTGCVPWWSGGQLYNYGINTDDPTYCYEAINYYLENSSSYTWQHSWYAQGDGIHNVYY